MGHLEKMTEHDHAGPKKADEKRGAGNDDAQARAWRRNLALKHEALKV